MGGLARKLDVMPYAKRTAFPQIFVRLYEICGSFGSFGLRLASKNKGAKIFGYVVWVPAWGASRLPTEETSLRIGPVAINTIKVHPPLSTLFHGMATD